MKTIKTPAGRVKSTNEFPLDKALRSKAARQDALDIIVIRERKNEPRVSGAEVFKKAGL